MKAAKTQKKLKNMPYPPQKKLWKIKGNSITPAQKNAPISQTSSEGLKLRTKALKMKLGQLQEDQKHLCQLVLIYVITLKINYFGNWPKKNLPFVRLILEEQQIYLVFYQ